MSRVDEDAKLDSLLGEIKHDPPVGALERTWEEIDSHLTWRRTMVARTFLQRSGLFRLGPVLAAASILLAAYVVGFGFMYEGRPLASWSGATRELFHTSAKQLAGEDTGPDSAVYLKKELDDLDAPMEEERRLDRTSTSTIAPDVSPPTQLGVRPERAQPKAPSWGGKHHELTLDEMKKKSAITIGGDANVDVEFRSEKDTARADNGLGFDEAGRKASATYRQARSKLFTAKPGEKPADGPAAQPLPTTDPTSTTTPSSGAREKEDHRRPINRPTGKTPPDDTTPPVRRPLQKVIKTAHLELEVKSYTPASHEVDDLVARYQGYYADSRVTQNDDGTTTAHIVIRVPQENFEALYAALKRIGRIKTESAKGEDVTAQYADLDARIRNAQHLENRLLALLEEKRRRDKMSEILEVEREIARVRQEVEGYQGQMRVLKDKIRFGTIMLTVSEPRRSVPQGRLGIEVKSVQAAEQALDQLVTSLKGSIASRHTTKRPDGTLSTQARLRVPLPAFSRLVEGLQALGRVADQNLEGHNVALRRDDAGAAAVHAHLDISLYEATRQTPAGTARIEVQTLAAAAQTLGGLLKQFDGSIKSRQEQRVSGGANATYVLRLPRKNYASAVAALATVGRVADKQFQGVDVNPVQGDAGEVPCDMTLVLFERSRQEPSGRAEISTPDLDQVAGQIRDLLARVQGQVQSYIEHRQPGSVASANYVLRCRRTRFADLVAGLPGVGRVENQQVQGLDLEPVQGAAADVLCSLHLTVHERRAPVPEAKLVLVIEDAKGAGDALKRLRDESAAETVASYTNQRADGSVDQNWAFRVTVEKFNDFVARASEIGRVRVKQVRGVSSGADEKPDPKALAEVRVSLVQRSPYAPSEEETAGSIRSAIRSAWKHFYASVAIIIYGLFVIGPWVLLLVGIHYGVKRLRRSGKPEAPKNEVAEKS